MLLLSLAACRNGRVAGNGAPCTTDDECRAGYHCLVSSCRPAMADGAPPMEVASDGAARIGDAAVPADDDAATGVDADASVEGGVAARAPVVQIAGGFAHTCALYADHSIDCWGENAYGESLAPAGPWKAVGAGYSFSCGLRMDGTLGCWGANDDGRATPPPGSFETLVVGGECACALDSIGRARCWGHVPATLPGLPAPKDGTVFKQLTVGMTHVCGLLADGRAVCWGGNADGEANPPPGAFKEIGAGFGVSCGLRADGGVTCWGQMRDLSSIPGATYAHLLVKDRVCLQGGDGNWACEGEISGFRGTSPPPRLHEVSLAWGRGYGIEAGEVVPWGPDPNFSPDPPTGPIASLTVRGYGCVLSPSGEADCWGASFPDGLPALRVLAVGDDIACGIPRDKPDFPDCWGNNLELPRGDHPSGPFTQIGAGARFACVLSGGDGKIACWGDDEIYTRPPIYGRVPPGVFAQLVVGSSQACALDENGHASCWGPAPIVPPAEAFTALALGDAHACGLRPDHTVRCWGRDVEGQGRAPAGGFLKIAAGAQVSCGIREDHTLACWGSNAYGRTAPPPGRFTDLAAGTQTCAVREDGKLLCWGIYRFSGR